MKRSPAELTGRTFDLLIVGGGIHGAALLREAALQGWEVALIEHGDFGHATSANSLKIIHGGLRYLQHGDLARTRESVLARRRLLRIAPHLVRPLPCVIPTYRWSRQGRLPLRAAFLLNDFLSRDRNIGVREGLHIPRGAHLSTGEMLDIAPGIERAGLSGGALWHDCIAEDTERLTLGFVSSAVEHGARAANYVKAENYVTEKNAIVGVEARDLINGTEMTIRARVVADATGPWLNRLLENRRGGEGTRPPQGWARAANMVIGKNLFQNHAVGLSRRSSNRGEPSGGQSHFFVPWRDVTLVGTWYWRHEGEDRNADLREEEILEMVGDVNGVYPAAELLPEDVVFAHLGFLPLVGEGRSGTVAKLLNGRSRIVDHEREGGLAGLIGIEGVKYTTAVTVAEKAVSLAAKKLGREARPLAEDPLLPGKAVHPSRAAVGEEVIHALRHEMACTLADVVFRRTGLGTARHPGGEALKECAALMAPEMGWDEGRVGREIAVVEEAYRSLLPLRGSPTSARERRKA